MCPKFFNNHNQKHQLKCHSDGFFILFLSLIFVQSKRLLHCFILYKIRYKLFLFKSDSNKQTNPWSALQLNILPLNISQMLFEASLDKMI